MLTVTRMMMTMMMTEDGHYDDEDDKDDVISTGKLISQQLKRQHINDQ